MGICGRLICVVFVLENWQTRDCFLGCVNQVGNYSVMMQDPIADMFTRIRNALGARHRAVEIPYSKLKIAIARLLLEEGYILSVEQIERIPKKPVILIGLKYQDSVPSISSIERVSTPGHRAYVKQNEIPYVQNDYGIAILSTSRGIMTNMRARKEGIGGEVIGKVF